MSFNVWGAGGNADKPIDETVAVLKAINADIIGLQETQLEGEICSGDICPARGESRAPAIAEALGYYYYIQTADNPALWSNAILSRWPIEGATKNDLGVKIKAPGHTIYAFNVHFWDYPYQPFQFAGIPYETAPFLSTPEEGVEAARAARGNAVDLLVSELGQAAGADTIFITGDFNEPSWRDWTERTKASGRHPQAVPFPATKMLEDAGLTDTYRAVHSDEMTHPGFTWTPTTALDDLADHHDRIDYVFARGRSLSVADANIVGEATPPAEIAITPWPSDHRAMVADIILGN
jgi:endonuclease/exonuclease/phosphatase family metal-dependent hydrolase